LVHLKLMPRRVEKSRRRSVSRLLTWATDYVQVQYYPLSIWSIPSRRRLRTFNPRRSATVRGMNDISLGILGEFQKTRLIQITETDFGWSIHDGLHVLTTVCEVRSDILIEMLIRDLRSVTTPKASISKPILFLLAESLPGDT
jgi:hypothetical protein